MSKAKQPTSQYQVFCDTFDTKAEAKIHKAGGKQKLLLTIGNEDGSIIKECSEASISLYREDIEMMIGFLQSALYFTENRNEPK